MLRYLQTVDAKINVGPDMAIWTKHFTKFVAYVAPAGGGGGGGGGAASVPGAVSDAVLFNAINNAAATGKVSLQAAATDTQLALSAAQINLVEATGKPLEITISGVTMTFNASVLKAAGYELGGQYRTGAERLSPQPAKTLAGKAANRSLYSILGDVFRLRAAAHMTNNTQQAVDRLNGSVNVCLLAPGEAKDAAAGGGGGGGAVQHRARPHTQLLRINTGHI
jgi:hypothetical protein